MTTLRLLWDLPAPGDGAWNMAVDEALLDSTAGGGAALRLYGWAPATLSLGYFQPAGQRADHPPSAACPLVRRATGGGAIVHDRELTYGFTAPDADRWSRAGIDLYRAFHETLIATLAEFGASARLCGPSPRRRPEEEPFLCFRRRAAEDVLLEGEKICGSAQRRRHGALLQHGSILLERSPHAPELPGIAELTGRPVLAEELACAWLARLGPRLGAEFAAAPLSAAEHAAARRIDAEKFAAAAWTHKR